MSAAPLARRYGVAPEASALRLPQPPARIYPLPNSRPRALFVAPEMSDFVQTGGLGAVCASLPRALRSSCDVRVLTPGYRETLARATRLDLVAHLPGLAEIPPCSIGAMTMQDGLEVLVILCKELFERDGGPYLDARGHDHPDNDLRFARLSLAAADIAARGVKGWRPDALHLNDWQGALAAGYLNWRGGADCRTVLTVHNLAHAGAFPAHRREALGIPPDAFGIDGVEFYGRLSFLKAGLQYADHVTTVSQTYAEEITGSDFGCGFEGLLALRASEGRLSGILNGLDPEWDPRLDKRCPYLFDPHRWKGRYADYVRGAHRLSLARAPMFAFVARLAHQKGVDLLIEASEIIAARGGQVVVMGRGEAAAERELSALATRHPEAIGFAPGFEPEEARAIFAGADFLLMPSRFEPCGLSQMYAQRFGALPIATRTGGLVETIQHEVTGLLFDRPEIGDFLEAIDRAFQIYQSPKEFQAMRRSAMAVKFDWRDSALRYAALYRGA